MTGAFDSSDKQFKLDMKIFLHRGCFKFMHVFKVQSPWSVREKKQYVCIQ